MRAIAFGIFTLLAPGCVGSLCRGVDCEDVYQAGQIYLVDTTSAESEVLRASTTLADLTGTVDEGTDWSAAVHQTSVFVGMPESSRIAKWEPEADGSSVSSLFVWRGPWRELGAEVVVVDPRDNGIPDLWASAPGHGLDAGAVIQWRAARAGGRAADANLVLHGASPADRLGETLVACPDLTGDGLPDLLVGAPRMSHAADSGLGTRAGGVFLLPSEAELVGELSYAEWSEQAILWSSAESGAAVGSAVACGGDLTGDGVPDIAIGAPGAGDTREGAVWVLSGADLPPAGALDTPTTVGSAAHSWLGTALAIGDLDADGVHELAAGASGANAGAGEVQVFYGPEMQLPRTVIAPVAKDEPPHVGSALLMTDLDADGHADLLVGAADWVDGADFDAGILAIWSGSTARLAPNLTLGEDEDITYSADHPFQRLGSGMVAHPLGLIVEGRTRGF
ncbi:MAG: FG-GAP repeat protein [Proteobacteria bacterium]|nr:FG-GAP repeat protein [Pseudomonadota bacterium]